LSKFVLGKEGCGGIHLEKRRRLGSFVWDSRGFRHGGLEVCELAHCRTGTIATPSGMKSVNNVHIITCKVPTRMTALPKELGMFLSELMPLSVLRTPNVLRWDLVYPPLTSSYG
jgi:hypothetical protein